MGGPDMAPHTPRPAPRSSWGLDRVSEPEGAPTSPPASRSSWGLDRVSEPDTAGGSSRPGGAVALLGISRAPAGYSRMVSNWNLHPVGVSAFTTLKPGIVS